MRLQSRLTVTLHCHVCDITGLYIWVISLYRYAPDSFVFQGRFPRLVKEIQVSVVYCQFISGFYQHCMRNTLFGFFLFTVAFSLTWKCMPLSVKQPWVNACCVSMNTHIITNILCLKVHCVTLVKVILPT